MTDEQATESLLGLPEVLEGAEVRKLLADLISLWEVTMGVKPGALSDDLQMCRRWFDPVAQGQRLRKELAALNPPAASWTPPRIPLVMDVGASKFLVTPEGRCAIDLLQRLPQDSMSVVRTTDLMAYDRRLAHLYKSWGRHRLQSVVDLLSGSDKPLQVPAAGVLVALLVNRCTDESRALTRFASGAKRRAVDEAFFPPVQAFADIISPSRGGNRQDPRLVSGWMLYEAGRRIGDGLAIIDAKKGVDGKVWIRPSAVDDVVGLVSRDLQRGHRSRASPQVFESAFDALVLHLREELPALAAYGLVHERPRETQRLREAFSRALEA